MRGLPVNVSSHEKVGSIGLPQRMEERREARWAWQLKRERAGRKRVQPRNLNSFIPAMSHPNMTKRLREASPPLQSPPTVLKPSADETVSIDEQNGPSKLVRVDGASQQLTAIVCSETPLCQSLPFSTYEEYEVHYHQTHTNRCIECKKNFPSERFLHLHIQETREKSHFLHIASPRLTYCSR